MNRVTVTLEDRHVYELRARQRLGEAGSRSAAIRDVFDEYEQLHTEYAEREEEYEQLHTENEQLRERIDDLQERLNDREDRIADLEEQLRERSRVEEKIEDLPDRLRERETYSERRQRLLDEATLAQRLKWKVTGVPVDVIDEERGREE